jgi:NTE family protein
MSWLSATRSLPWGAGLVAGIAAGLMSACATPPDRHDIDVSIEPPRHVTPSEVPKPRVAVVLSGGAVRGFAHIGVLRVLEREGLRPDLVVGSSVGAIVGALYASGMPLRDIESFAARLDWGTLFDFDPVRSLLGGFGLGLVKGKRFEAVLREALPAPMQAFPTRFAAVATDLNTGETVVLNHGDAPRALRASTAIPVVYEPVKSDGRLLGDGQITSPMPVAAARQLGAQVVIAVDVVYPPQHSAMSNPFSVLFQTMLISTYRHLMNERAQADVVLSPVMVTSGQLGLGDRDWVIRAGEFAAEQALPHLRAVFKGP